ncbi:MAG: 50S ribosomal protein L3 [Ignavibacteriaceae bacterium]|mgnify:CR=1 FL=1|jgi:LSU ribosomal protein L3P|nr:MAG: 50S ribosomal protein L3 [Chlorobi bacterium OLB4]MBV6398419.1 50S ribosomal protein L3 [Ignavibacteria bacterium]MCE7952761.1 50S ribosomal protein L3 [Chlorobi bacterium CHB7]MEB2330219.1 50S ribosomal protein L3 [Ignavibacteriaceae bacterium]OQY77902.1 MAG: 50S ribosomal protein L3 [Ignavibacteriales bacterium UTCHB1]RIK50394.1 MAG: 50S ribosomal protein L3 [Ignavibacteriota bacterium]
MVGILGKKLGMTTFFTDNGEAVPCTVIEAGPCHITQIKTLEKDGYNAVQLGFGTKHEKNVNKPQRVVFSKLNIAPQRYLHEIRDYPVSEEKPGDSIKVNLFKSGDKVKVSGISKGKGFQGVMKRHGFGGGVQTHGQSDRSRAPGSIGQSSYPSRVFKGLKMAGRMGGNKTTVRNLKVIKVFDDSNLLLIKGAVPGAINSLVEILKD